jgi:stage V sporulation protein AC
MMQMSNEEYAALVKARMPASPFGSDLVKAFVIGGLICCLGQGFLELYGALGAAQEDAAAWCSVTLVFLGALTTGLGFYDDLARHGGAGTLVPITGFANAVASPALEFKTEGMVAGLAAKIFLIAGPVITFGILASALYGVVLLLFGIA